MPSFQGAVALLLASAVVWSSAQQLCHDQGTTCEDISVPDPAPGTMMMQVNRKVAAAAVSPVPLALNAGMTRVATAGGALQAVQLEESRSCVPMALQEIHLQSIRQYAAMLATGHKAQPLQKAPSASASPTKIESMKNDDDQGKQLVQIAERLDSSSGKDAASTTKQPEGKPTAAPKNHTAHEKPAHKKEPKHKWVSHPNIESMMSDENLVQIGERSSSGKDAVSTTKQPEGKPTAAPKNHTAHEKPAHKKEPKHKWVSHPNIESMKNKE